MNLRGEDHQKLSDPQFVSAWLGFVPSIFVTLLKALACDPLLFNQ